MIGTALPPDSPPLMRLTCERYHSMIRAGQLTENDSIELINGYLVTKMSIGPNHSSVRTRLERLLNRRFGDTWLIRGQEPITIHEYSEPEPDIVVAKFRDDFYAERHPHPEDILLIIEVADTSLSFDRSAKVPLYASCGIAETWLVDLTQREVTAYRRPAGASYAEAQVYRAGDVLPLPGASGESIAVTELGL